MTWLLVTMLTVTGWAQGEIAKLEADMACVNPGVYSGSYVCIGIGEQATAGHNQILLTLSGDTEGSRAWKVYWQIGGVVGATPWISGAEGVGSIELNGGGWVAKGAGVTIASGRGAGGAVWDVARLGGTNECSGDAQTPVAVNRWTKMTQQGGATVTLDWTNQSDLNGWQGQFRPVIAGGLIAPMAGNAKHYWIEYSVATP